MTKMKTADLESENRALQATIDSALSAIAKMGAMHRSLQSAFRKAGRPVMPGKAINKAIRDSMRPHMPCAPHGSLIGDAVNAAVHIPGVRLNRTLLALAAIDASAKKITAERKPGKAIKKMAAPASAKPARSPRGKRAAGQPRSDAPRAQR